jgi:hypothetical protein
MINKIKKIFSRKQLKFFKDWGAVIFFIIIFAAAASIDLLMINFPERVPTAQLMKETRECLNSTDEQLQCINQELRKIAQNYGVKPALDVIEPLSSEFTHLLNWSHEFSHTIGDSAIAYREYKDGILQNQIGKALVECDGFGAFGCYHGVIESGLSILPVEKRASVIREACMENPLIQGKQYFVNQCLHWFGHGVAIFSDLTLNDALAMCDGLGPFNSDDVQLCLSGLFHSGAVPGKSDDDLLHNIANVWKKDDPYYPCLNIEEKFKGHCFSHSPGRTRSEDTKLLFRVCDNIPEADRTKKLDYVWRCYDSAANVVLPQVLKDTGIDDSQKAEKIVSECRNNSNPVYRKFCYAGAARYWVLRDPSLTNLNPFKICNAAENSARPICYSNIGFGNNENYYSEEKRIEYCNNGQPEYMKYCLAAQPTLYLK